MKEVNLGKTIALGVLAVFIGTFGGMVIMTGLHFVAMPLYPPPEGLDVMDPAQQEQMKAWMATLPAGAFAVAALCHWLGSGSGAVIAMFITGRRSILPAVIVGAIFTVAGYSNVMQVPHPGWFPFVDLPGYLALATLAGWLLLRQPEAPTD